MLLRRFAGVVGLLGSLATPGCREGPERADATARQAQTDGGGPDAGAPTAPLQPAPLQPAPQPAPPRSTPSQPAQPRRPEAGPGALYSLEDPWRMSLVDVQGRGVMIERLDIRSFAAPLLQPGDLIIGVNDRPVTTSRDVELYLRSVPPGSLVVVTVRRDDAIHYVMLQVPA